MVDWWQFDSTEEYDGVDGSSSQVLKSKAEVKEDPQTLTDNEWELFVLGDMTVRIGQYKQGLVQCIGRGNRKILRSKHTRDGWMISNTWFETKTLFIEGII